jgi:beta-phosphoglucomutase
LCSLRDAGLRIALATSAGRQRTQSILADLDLLSFFDAVVTGDEVDRGKPDPSIYRLATKRMRKSPRHLIAVEDAVSGVQSARAAGIRCVGVATAERAPALRAAGAYPVVPSLGYLSLSALKRADSHLETPDRCPPG